MFFKKNNSFRSTVKFRLSAGWRLKWLVERTEAIGENSRKLLFTKALLKVWSLGGVSTEFKCQFRLAYLARSQLLNCLSDRLSKGPSRRGHRHRCRNRLYVGHGWPRYQRGDSSWDVSADRLSTGHFRRGGRHRRHSSLHDGHGWSGQHDLQAVLYQVPRLSDWQVDVSPAFLGVVHRR